MALLKRKDRDTSSLPEEVQDYYDSSRRERAGVAWALAFLTLIVTVLLSLGIFFGGRRAYRAVFDRSSNQTAATDESQQNISEQAPAGDSEHEDRKTDTRDTSTPDSTTSNASDGNGTTGFTPGEIGGGDSESEPARPTPTTGPLPDTGPGSNPL